MKKIILFLLINTLPILCYCQTSFGNPYKINSNWKFQKGDVSNASDPLYDDSKWRILDLPHDWSIEGALSPGLFSCTGYLPAGVAWYRKTLEFREDTKNKKVYIYFEGIYRNGEVYINGTRIGMRPNGYISYMFDLTPYIKTGEKNVVAVRVDHSKVADSRWYTGSGIYRDVYLIISNPVHINQWGVYCTTPQVKPDQATVNIQTTVQNSTHQSTCVIVEQKLMDTNGKLMGKNVRKIKILAQSTQTVNQEIKVSKPNLWSLGNPYLYVVKSSILKGVQIIDTNNSSIGIRFLGFDANKGFSLNGKSLKLKGVCLHHDAGCLGAAVPAEVWERRLRVLKSTGCNAIRCSHNPQTPIIYDLCDKLGLLVLNEAFDEWEFPKKKWLEGWNNGVPGFDGSYEFFEKWSDTDIKDFIMRDRNHPSIIMWSIGNEIDYPNDPYSHLILDKEEIGQPHARGYLKDHPNAERLGVIAKRLVATVKRYDNSRPVTAALAGPVMSNETEYPGALDVVGYNYTENRYDMDHKLYANRIFYGSENGLSLENWKYVRDNPYIFGQFIWTGIDYLGEAGAWPSRGFGEGLIDLSGFKKGKGYFAQSLWSEEPMIYIGTYEKNSDTKLSMDAFPVWNYKNGDTIRVVCYTNCQKAQLMLNGNEVLKSKNYNDETGIIYWDIPYAGGRLEACGYKNNKEVARYEIQTSKEPKKIKAKILNESLSESDVIQVEVQVVDENENLVMLADNEISCVVTGSAKLIGLEASNMTDMGNYTDNKQRVFHGKLIAYIKSTSKGPVDIKFSSLWLGDEIIRCEF